MPTQLSPVEARILGALIEKSFTTPEQYPLSFNALQNACNQKSSRDPVLDLSTDDVAQGIAALSEKSLVVERVGSRVPKYAHYAEHLGVGETPEVLGIVAMLLLRGPQTAAELRVRSERIGQLQNTAAAEAVLETLLGHSEGPVVARLSRGRFQELFTGTAPAGAPVRPAAPAIPAKDRVAELERRVQALEERCRELESKPGNPH
jgi:uncharacterized protein YceH (UPF0502 family)